MIVAARHLPISEVWRAGICPQEDFAHLGSRLNRLPRRLDFRDNLSAKMLMNKDVSKWLLIAPATRDPKQIDKHLNRLKIIAARNPALSSDIQALYQGIVRAANENVARAPAAASGNADEEDGNDER